MWATQMKTLLIIEVISFSIVHVFTMAWWSSGRIAANQPKDRVFKSI